MFGYLLNSQQRTQLSKTWGLAWPVILANLSLPLLSLVDASILGHLPDSVYLAGVTVGGSLMAYIFWGFNFLSMGLSGFTSQLLGKGDYAGIQLQLKKYCLVAIALIVLVLCLHRVFIQAGLAVIGPASDIAQEANVYLSIRMLGVPAIVFNTMLLGFFIGLQNTRISLYSLSITQIMNIGLNLLFVFGFGYKTAGIALGTVISEYMGLGLILWHLRKTWRHHQSITTITHRLAFRWSEFTPIFHVSSHLFVRTFVLLTAFVWFNRMAANFGSVALAANGVLLAFFTLISHFLDGTAAAAEAQTGHAVGQNNPALLRQVWGASATLNACFMISLSGLFFVGGGAFLHLLTNQNDIYQYAYAQLTWVAILPLTGGIAFWLDGVFIGARRSKDMRNSVLIAFAFFVLGSWFFAQSNTQLWMWFNVFFAARSFWLLTVFYKKMLSASA
ncbi:MATE family efflux transporter [Reinekea sp. G2M2-21]|uniref:MATE family efflux transporter n=1 Tax=Reinekea sp. G2M2-21 TaxID=2788942 RepID=UPI0018A88FB8|nr:MATE family efflux transporter [Reinekea sp. G2M2-21]